MAKITYDKDGRETQASVKRRIAEFTGFQYSKIELMEGNAHTGIYDTISFQVNGRGFITDCDKYLEPAHQFDQDVLDEQYAWLS